jgi:flagellar biosynthetic protein FlhB
VAEAEHDDRTESPTQKRIDEARRNGQIPRSRDLSAAAVMLTAGVGLQVLGPTLGQRLGALMRGGLSFERADAFDPSRMAPALGEAAFNAAITIAPILALTLVAALGAPLALGGWAFSPGVLAPRFDRLDPQAGFGRMFSLRSGVELGKALAKFAVVATAGIIVFAVHFQDLMGLGSEPIGTAIGHAIGIGGQALTALTAALIFIAAIDVPFQLWQYHRDLRMTREEIRQEARESDGSPEVKSHIRRLQRERAQRRMMLDVPKADVIVVNPTHYAVALRYDDKRHRAPVVVAKGVDFMAARIREVAAEHQVPIFEAPPLARALHRTVEIGDEIPSTLYVAVAQVLTYIFQLRAARREKQAPPPVPVIDFRE